MVASDCGIRLVVSALVGAVAEVDVVLVPVVMTDD